MEIINLCLFRKTNFFKNEGCDSGGFAMPTISLLPEHEKYHIG